MKAYLSKRKLIVLGSLLGLIIVLGIIYNFYLSYNSGTLKVSTNASGVTIKVNNRSRGKAPLEIRLLEGGYELSAEGAGYEKATKHVEIKKAETKEISFELRVTGMSDDQFNRLSPQEKDSYQVASDTQTDKDEGLLREKYPLVKDLPYTDPDLRFKIDYSGEIEKASFQVTLFGKSNTEFETNKALAIDWVISKGANPGSLKIDYSKEWLGGEEP